MSNVTDQQAFARIQERANALVNAGIGLETIGNLLGADSSEHGLCDEEKTGLAHTVAALGSLVSQHANEVWSYAAPDREEWI
ncbi:hypothetical protein [Pseudomonas sp. Marseille-QA0892]